MKLRKPFSLGTILLIAVSVNTSCQKTQNASAEQVATQFGEGAQDPAIADGGLAPADASGTQPMADNSEGRNRFGFAGADEPVKPLRRDTQSYSPDEEKTKLKDRIPGLNSSTDQISKIEAPKPPAVAASDSSIVKLGFASKISGDDLHVTLPGEYASLGQISVEKMDPAGNSLGSPWARGTQMQIPNPKVPGGKIYFKVP